MLSTVLQSTEMAALPVTNTLACSILAMIVSVTATYYLLPSVQINRTILLITFTTACSVGAVIFSRSRPVYLLAYACFCPPATCRVPFAKYKQPIRLCDSNNDSNIDLQKRILERSGFGEVTRHPPGIHCLPVFQTMEESRAETEKVIFSVVDELFAKTFVNVNDIIAVIVNCSRFAPTSSIEDIVVNRYKLRSDIRAYNLCGMGCSADIIAVDLARQILKVQSNCHVLIISTEILTPKYYSSNTRSMLFANCLFRMGGAAALLSNSADAIVHPKYRLLHVVRTHHDEHDNSFHCVVEGDDVVGEIGISLSKDLLAVANEALRSNIIAIAPLVLPVIEQLRYLLALLGRHALSSSWPAYLPNFHAAFSHFCIHAGGRAVIDKVQRSLRLRPEDVEASRMALHRFGNNSSSSLWYELAYTEAKGRVKKGDNVWMIAFGSGFKCNRAVWQCLTDIVPAVEGPGADCLHRYPVDVAVVENVA